MNSESSAQFLSVKVQSWLLLAALLLLSLSLAACGSRRPGSSGEEGTNWMEDIEDTRLFPQNLQVYAEAAGPDRRLLSMTDQALALTNFERIFFGAWQQTRTSIRTRDVANLFSHARGYKNATQKWTQAEWDSLRDNADLANFPSQARPAITLRNTDLRELPTALPRFSEPTPDILRNPFDYFQYSVLPPGTPVLVAHSTRDGKWYYIECPVAGGWVSAKDVAYVDSSFMSSWRSGSYAALVRDGVNLPDTGLNGTDSESGIGTILPSAATNDALTVFLPIAGPDGVAQIAETVLAPQDAAQVPLPLTPRNVALVGNQMLGQPYGWGGTNGNRDCSSMIRDLFVPFGIWLPRNSAAQARRGAVTSLVHLSNQEKAQTIIRNGVPFLSLLGMQGHIALYVGVWKGRPAIFHDTWGIRVIRNGNDDERCIIGRAVVTSISPGAELKELYRATTFTDRLRTLTTPER